MADPFKIENQFQSLRQSLTLTASPRLRLRHIMEFVNSVVTCEEQIFLPAYMPELLFSFSSVAGKCNFTGTPIAFVQELIRFSELMSTRFPDLVAQEEWSAAFRHLRQEERRIEAWLRARKSPGQADLILSEEAVYDAVWIPFVETEALLDVQTNPFGALRCLHVKCIPKPGKGGKDEVHLGTLAGANEPMLENALIAVAAAKRLLKLCIGERASAPLLVQGWLDGPHAVSGDSMQAGLALGLFAEQLHTHGYREQYTLCNNMAITGSIDSTGRLLPVDAEGLRAKVEACTFSWITHLVVPEEQVETARGYAHDAVSALGDEPVVIVGVRSIGDVLANRHLTGLRRVSWPVRAAGQVWKRRVQIAAACILLLVLILAKVWYGPFDRDPVQAAFEKNHLVVKNARGEILYDQPSSQNEPGSAYNLDAGPALYDVDGDGTKEVIYSLISSGGLSRLQCSSLSGDRVHWTVDLKRRILCPRQGGLEREEFGARVILAGDFDQDGSAEVLCLTLHSYFPSLLLKLDAKTGRELSAYLHIGNLASMVAQDLDGDARQEIVLGGVNQALRQACIVVLDPGHIEGHSLLNPAYAVEGWAPAVHRAYLILPKTVVNEAFKASAKWNFTSSISVTESSKRIKAKIQDQGEFADYSATLYLDLDFGLRPLEFGTSDVYDMTAERMLKEKRISRLPDKPYFDGLLAKVRSWDGKKWRSALDQRRTSNLLPPA